MGCCGKSESVIYLTHFLWINVNVVRRCITNYIYMTYKLLVFVCKFIRYYLHVSSENTHLETKALIYVYKMFSSTFYQLLTSECWGHTSPYTGKNIKIIIEATIYIRLLFNYQIKFHVYVYGCLFYCKGHWGIKVTYIFYFAMFYFLENSIKNTREALYLRV